VLLPAAGDRPNDDQRDDGEKDPPDRLPHDAPAYLVIARLHRGDLPREDRLHDSAVEPDPGIVSGTRSWRTDCDRMERRGDSGVVRDDDLPAVAAQGLVVTRCRIYRWIGFAVIAAA